MVYRQVVHVKPLTKDRYRRTIAWVSVGNESLNKELVRAGLAWWFRRYAPHDRDLEYLEMEARKARAGLWSHPDPVPPWKFRHSKRRPVRQSDGTSP